MIMRMISVVLGTLAIALLDCPADKAAGQAAKHAAARLDQYGDPLPDGAIVRLGTVRFRHGRLITAVAYTPDGKSIISAGFDQTIRVWDAATGKQLRRIGKTYPRMTSIAISPDGRYLAGSIYENFQDKYSCIWDLTTGQEFGRFEDSFWGGAAVFSVDGKWVATSAENKIRIWDWQTGKEFRKCEGHQGQVLRIVVSRDGTRLASAAGDGTVRLWDVATARELHNIAGLEGVTGLVISPDGKTLVTTASSDARAIHLLDIATGKERLRIEAAPEKQAVNCFTFSPDGKLLASANGYFTESRIALWDPATGKLVKRMSGPPGGAWAIAFSPDSRSLTVGGPDNVVHQWDVTTGVERQPRGEHQSHVEAVAVSPDGKLIATGCRDQHIRVWEVAACKLLFECEQELLHDHSRLAFSADGKLLASTNIRDFKVRLWDTATHQVISTLSGHSDRIDALQFLADGRTLMSWSREGKVRRWDWRSAKEIDQTAGPPPRFYQAAFAPDGTLAFGAADVGAGSYALYLWDTSTGKVRHEWNRSGLVPECLAFSGDGQWVAAGGEVADAPTVCVWHVGSGKEWRIPPDTARKRILAVAFSPDSKTVAAGCGRDIEGWEMATGQQRHRLSGHQGQITCLAFSSTGRTLISGSEDTSAIVWDMGTQIDPLPPADIDKLWAALASKDAAEAYRAIWRLVSVPDQSVALFKDRLRPTAPVDPKRYSQLVRDLDSDQFAVRTKAAEEIERMGDAAVTLIQETLKSNVSLEVRRRLEGIQARCERPITAPELLRTLRAIEALEHIGTAQAKEVLTKLAGGAAGAMVTQEAKASLERLARREADSEDRHSQRSGTP